MSKLTTIILVCGFFGWSSSFGQVLVGPVLGGQMCFMSYDDKGVKDMYKLKPYFGFHAGGSLSFRVQKNFFLQTSILYSQKGKHMEGIDDKIFRNDATYRFIDMPILFTKEVKLKIGKNRFYKLHLGVGPNISYWLGGKGLLKNSDLNENGINPPNYDLPYKITFGNDPQNVSLGQMNVQYPNRVQLGLIFSVGAIFEPVGFNRFMISANYQLGHSFMSPNSKGDFGSASQLSYQDDLRIRNMVIGVSGFYFIDLKTADRKKGKSTLKIK